MLQGAKGDIWGEAMRGDPGVWHPVSIQTLLTCAHASSAWPARRASSSSAARAACLLHCLHAAQLWEAFVPASPKEAAQQVHACSDGRSGGEQGISAGSMPQELQSQQRLSCMWAWKLAWESSACHDAQRGCAALCVGGQEGRKGGGGEGRQYLPVGGSAGVVAALAVLGHPVLGD